MSLQLPPRAQATLDRIVSGYKRSPVKPQKTVGGTVPENDIRIAVMKMGSQEAAITAIFSQLFGQLNKSYPQSYRVVGLGTKPAIIPSTVCAVVWVTPVMVCPPAAAASCWYVRPLYITGFKVMRFCKAVFWVTAAYVFI